MLVLSCIEFFVHFFRSSLYILLSPSTSSANSTQTETWKFGIRLLVSVCIWKQWKIGRGYNVKCTPNKKREEKIDCLIFLPISIAQLNWNHIFDQHILKQETLCWWWNDERSAGRRRDMLSFIALQHTSISMVCGLNLSLFWYCRIKLNSCSERRGCWI